MTTEQARNEVCACAVGELNYREGPGNWNKYAAMPEMTQLLGWNAQNQPWCNTFVNGVFIRCFGLEIGAAMLYQPIGGGSALCRTSADFFKTAGAWIERGRTPSPGDVIFFYVRGVIDHQGIVTQVTAGSVITVEGNSSDMVAERVYSVSDGSIAGYGRPRWELAADVPTVGTTDAETADSAAVEPKPADFGANVQESEKHARYYTLRLPYLSRGDEGRAVQAAQGALIAHRCTCGPDGADGDFGGNTEAAVRQFQRLHSLAPDGTIGPETGAALFGGEVVKETNINGLGQIMARKVKGET